MTVLSKKGKGKMEKAIIVVGTLSDGFRFIGPFESFDEASDYAYQQLASPSWIATLEAS